MNKLIAVSLFVVGAFNGMGLAVYAERTMAPPVCQMPEQVQRMESLMSAMPLATRLKHDPIAGLIEREG